jgi:hypothetical protein
MLPYLSVLVCPLMMILIMKGHGGHDGLGAGQQQRHGHLTNELDSKMTKLELDRSILL